MKLTIKTLRKREVIDITNIVAQNLKHTGLVNIYVAHTSAAIAISNLDPGTDEDILSAIERLTPLGDWKHAHNSNHFPDHLWSSLIGVSVSIPYVRGVMELGKWQRIILIELDGPKERQIIITTIASKEQ